VFSMAEARDLNLDADEKDGISETIEGPPCKSCLYWRPEPEFEKSPSLI
jgi:hypothetical protein